jgi:hypothetical protein
MIFSFLFVLLCLVVCPSSGSSGTSSACWALAGWPCVCFSSILCSVSVVVSQEGAFVLLSGWPVTCTVVWPVCLSLPVLCASCLLLSSVVSPETPPVNLLVFYLLPPYPFSVR